MLPHKASTCAIEVLKIKDKFHSPCRHRSIGQLLSEWRKGTGSKVSERKKLPRADKAGRAEAGAFLPFAFLWHSTHRASTFSRLYRSWQGRGAEMREQRSKAGITTLPS